MGCSFVWVKGLKCERGHDLDPQSTERNNYCGYPSEAVPLDVAEDLRDNPFFCMICTAGLSQEKWQSAIDAAGSRGFDDCMTPAARHMGYALYRLRFTSEPRYVCESCGKTAACGCHKVVAVVVEKVT